MATGDVAFDGSTRSVRPAQLIRKSRGVSYSVSTNVAYSTMDYDGSYALPSGTYSTGDDLIRIPFRDNKDLLLAVYYVTPTTNLPYPALIIKKPPKSKNEAFGYSTAYPRPGGAITSSTKDAGYTMLVSTAALSAAATSEAYMVTWQIHPGRYAHNDGASTGAGTNAYENYLEVAPVLTAAQGKVDNLDSTQFTSLQCSSFGYKIAHVLAFEIDA